MEGISLGAGLLTAVVVFIISLAIDAVYIWVAVRMIARVPDATFGRAFLCAFLLNIVAVLAILCFLVPLPLLNVLLALLVLFLGSKAVIEGTFELVEGGCAILILYMVLKILVGVLLSAL